MVRVLALIVLLLPRSPLAQEVTKAEATGSVTIIEPVGLALTAPLSIASVSSGSAAGRASGGGTFTVNAPRGQTIHLEVSRSLPLAGPSGPSALAVNVSLGGAGIILAEGSQQIQIGGSIALGSGASPGAYSGTMSVLANLN